MLLNANPWLCLLVAGLLEIVWLTALKFSDGFTRPGPTVFALVTSLASFWLLSLAIRSIPVGTGYAVWTGIGAAGAAIAGILLFAEPATAIRLAFIGLIVAGVIGLQITGQP